MGTNYTYIVECSDKTYYTGWTTDIDKRLRVHNAGKGAKYTKPRLPVKLAYLEIHETKQQAMQREAYIKGLTRKEKEKLIMEWGDRKEN
ncbi:MAG: GIY-YIG nuclease family protein [Lachnospiraceae bacterium]|nr:GIY-YIG nuclease family protein [Lachnospiraceae bacterium]